MGKGLWPHGTLKVFFLNREELGGRKDKIEPESEEKVKGRPKEKREK